MKSASSSKPIWVNRKPARNFRSSWLLAQFGEFPSPWETRISFSSLKNLDRDGQPRRQKSDATTTSSPGLTLSLLSLKIADILMCAFSSAELARLALPARDLAPP